MLKRPLYYGYLLSYIVAVVPPIINDPLLNTHIRYGPRYYPLAYLTFLLLAILAISEMIIIRRAENASQLYLSLIPYAFVTLLTFPIFLPEFPHGCIIFTSSFILTLSSITITILMLSERMLLPSNIVCSQARIDYLKEAISLSKQIGFGLVAAFSAFFITLFIQIIAYNRATVTDPSEFWLMSFNTGFQFGFISIYFVFAPLRSSIQFTVALLSQMKEITQQPSRGDYSKRTNPQKTEKQSEKK